MEDNGRVVVVTGGSRGIGRSVAFRFAEEKARLIILHYDPDDRDSLETRHQLTGLGCSPEIHKIDVSSKEQVDSVFKDIISTYGKVDVLVNNAGIARDGLLLRMSEDDWDLVLDVNLKSVFNCTKAVLRSMIKQRKGSVVSIASIAGQIGNAGQANYAASKAGIMGFTKAIAREVASRGITVNAVAPGFIETEMTAELPDKVIESYLQQIPLGRLGTTREVAEAVYWLCSGSAGYITGQIIHVNGGMFM
jgi:3-oxoacyl-[acyl-carrier protein] reductase